MERYGNLFDARLSRPFVVTIGEPYRVGLSACFENDIILAGQCSIDISRYSIKIAKRRHRARRTVRKQIFEFCFAFQRGRFSRYLLEFFEVNSSIRRKYRHQMLASGSHHDHLVMVTTLDMLSRRNGLSGKRFWMLQYFVSDFFVVQIANQFVRYFHNPPPLYLCILRSRRRPARLYRLESSLDFM